MMDSARLDELERLRFEAIQEKQSPSYSMDAQTAYIAALVFAAPDLIEHIRKQSAVLEGMRRKHDTAIELYSEYHDANANLRNDLYAMERQRDLLAAEIARERFNVKNCKDCKFRGPCYLFGPNIVAKDADVCVKAVILWAEKTAEAEIAHDRQIKQI